MDDQLQANDLSNTIAVLIVEDDPADAFLLERQLSTLAFDDVRICHQMLVGDAVTRLQKESFDLVLLDLTLPDGSGLENVDRLLEACPNTPIVILTGLEDDTVAVEAVARGAQDYLVKGSFDDRVLAQTIRYSIERQRLLGEIRTSNQQEQAIKDKLFSHVSHELRTPLTAIQHFATILEDGIAGQLNDKQTEFVGVIQRNIVQLKQMISDLMDVTRIDNDKLSCERSLVDVADVAQRAIAAVESVAFDKHIEIEREFDNTVGPIVGDAGRLEQVLVNLLSNAIKFTPDCGSVTVSIKPDTIDPQRIQVVVDDTGCGLPAEQTETVFARLFQDERNETSRQGLGLGLFITRSIVEQHGGNVSAANRPEGGASFRISLPTYSFENCVREFLSNSYDSSQTGLIAVAVDSTAAAPLESARRFVMREVQRVLQACTIDATDVVLPIACHPENRRSAFALAACDAQGLATIESRIRRKLEALPSMASRGFSTTVSTHGVEVDLSTELDERTSAVAERLETIIRTLATTTTESEVHG